jgi:hypothetical protein
VRQNVRIDVEGNGDVGVPERLQDHLGILVAKGVGLVIETIRCERVGGTWLGRERWSGTNAWIACQGSVRRQGNIIPSRISPKAPLVPGRESGLYSQSVWKMYFCEVPSQYPA